MLMRKSFSQWCIPAVYLLLVASLCGSMALRGWADTWRPIVPTMSPVFADMRTVQGAIQSERLGFDPHFSNPGDPWARLMNYPGIWLSIAKTLSLDLEERFIAFVGLYVAAFLAILFWLLCCYPSIPLLVACCSTATFLAIERGNNDLVVFVFVALGLIQHGSWGLACCLVVASVLKLFPIVACFTLLRKPSLLLMTLLGFGVYVMWQWADMLGTVHGVPTSAYLSFGTKSLAALLNYSVRWWILLILHVALAALVWHFMRAQLRSLLIQFMPTSELFDTDLNPRARLFFGGGSIYLFTYAVSSSFDYRLIFLILCIPALTKATQSRLGLVLLVAVCISMFEYWMGRLGSFGRLTASASKAATFVLLSALFAEYLLLVLVTARQRLGLFSRA
jgi:hypothetical protein